MSDAVVRIGGIVRPDPDPEQGLSRIADDLDDEEFADWMRDYREGRWVLVCVQMFADVAADGEVTRFGDGGVRSLYFGVPHGEDNLAHAREAVAEYADSLAAALNDNDVKVTPDELARLPILIELDSEVEAQLS